ncbi:MAG: hypothetical protein ACM3S1_14410 [Hyphomicrobiales bacterium]
MSERAGFRPLTTPSILLRKHRALVLDLLAEYSALALSAPSARRAIVQRVLAELERQACAETAVLEPLLGTPIATQAERAEIRELVLRHFQAPQPYQGHTLSDVADLLDQVTNRLARIEDTLGEARFDVAAEMMRRREVAASPAVRGLVINYRARPAAMLAS